ncbi:MAG: VOC family protein [Firmicutes bacterium]|nr:VOC family protein [Bacillota bacterium]
MPCKIQSLYICVRDMERAIRFYGALFDQKVSLKDEIYSVFDLEGFRFGLFAFEKKKEAHQYGNSCLPSIEFESVNLLQEKLIDKTITFPLTKIGKNMVVEILDSEGNTLELYAPWEH